MESVNLNMNKVYENDSVTWIGHSTTLINLNNTLIYTDPIFSERIIIVKRKIKLPAEKYSFPKADVILISHNHYDHMDIPTIELIGRNALIITPKKAGEPLKKRGFNVKEMMWNEKLRYRGLEIVSVKTKHFSGRIPPFDQNKSLWSGYVISSSDHKTIFFAGDTGYFPELKSVGDKYKIDLAILPIGAYKPRWFMKRAHLNPEEAVILFKEIKAKYMLPVHFGTFQLGLDTTEEALSDLEKAIEKHKMNRNSIILLKAGETFPFPTEK